jgi:hypothetical protein
VLVAGKLKLNKDIKNGSLFKVDFGIPIRSTKNRKNILKKIILQNNIELLKNKKYVLP